MKVRQCNIDHSLATVVIVYTRFIRPYGFGLLMSIDSVGMFGIVLIRS